MIKISENSPATEVIMAANTQLVKYPIFGGPVSGLDLNEIPAQLHSLIEVFRAKNGDPCECSDVMYSQALIPPHFYPTGDEGAEDDKQTRSDLHSLSELGFCLFFTIKCSKSQKRSFERCESVFKLQPSGTYYGRKDRPYSILKLLSICKHCHITYGLFGHPGYLKYVEARRERFNKPDLTVLDALEDKFENLSKRHRFAFGTQYFDLNWCDKLPINRGDPQRRIHEAEEIRKTKTVKVPEYYQVEIRINGVDLNENLALLVDMVKELNEYRVESIPELTEEQIAKLI